jgi:hypothetical protein
MVVQMRWNRSFLVFCSLLGSLVGALLFGACGGGTGSGGADPAAAFAGNWTFQDGSVTPACSGIVFGDIALSGDTASVTRIDAGHVALAFSNAQLTCHINFTVSESTATAEAGQTCSISVMGTTIPVAITSWTMTLSGTSISMSMSGKANALIVSCMPSGTGTLVQPAP